MMDNLVKVYIISDNHFGHESIIKHCSRPFKDVDEMNKVMATRWNNTVGPKDMVLVLGDIGLHNRGLDWNLIKSLQGNKILVRGNHDRKSNHYYFCNGFVFVCNQFVWGKYIFTHTPLAQTNALELKHYIYNFHGHIHQKSLNDSQSINVSVEQPYMDYTPRLLTKLIEFRASRKWGKDGKKNSD